MRYCSVRKLIATGALALSSMGALSAQTPLETEFKVPESTMLTQDSQSLAVARDGSFLVVWRDTIGTEIPYTPVGAARFFDSQGQPLTGDLRLPSDSGSQPFALARPGGGFRIFWGGVKSGAVNYFLQSYSPDGHPTSMPVLYPIPDKNGLLITNVVATPKERVLLSWISSDNPLFAEVKLLKLSPRGRFLGDEIIVDADENDLFVGDVGVDRQGTVTVVWTGDCGPEGQEQCDVFAQRISASGEKLGGRVRVNTSTKGIQENVKIAITPDGESLMTWHSFRRTENGLLILGIFGQRFSADGKKVGKEFRVNAKDGLQVHPIVAADPAGNYLVVWARVEPENGFYGWNIYGQLYRHDGTKVSREVRLNTRNTFNELPLPKAAFGGNGTFVAVWNANDGDFDGVYGQRFSASMGAEPCVLRGSELLCDVGRTGSEAELSIPLASGEIVFGDVDSDGRKDPCLFQAGRFQCDTDHRGASFEATVSFGATGDKPLFGDVDGDGKEEPCVRRGRFHLCDTARNGGRAEASFSLGTEADQPLLGDIDGDGRDEACVFQTSGGFLCATRRGTIAIQFGQAGDVGALGDFDGDGDDDPCVYRAGKFLCDTAHDGGAAEAELAFGQAGDRPLLANLDGL